MKRHSKALQVLAWVVLAGVVWDLWITFKSLYQISVEWHFWIEYEPSLLWRIVAINVFPFLAADVLLGIMAVRVLLEKRPLKVLCWITVALLATRLYFIMRWFLNIGPARMLWLDYLRVALQAVAPALLLWLLLAKGNLPANVHGSDWRLKEPKFSPMPRFRLVGALAALLKVVAWLSLVVGIGLGCYAYFYSRRSYGGWYGYEYSSHPFRESAWYFFAAAIVNFIGYMIHSAFCAAFVQSAGGWRARIQRATGFDVDLPRGSRSAWLLFAGWLLRVLAVLLAIGGIVLCHDFCRDGAWLPGFGCLLAFALMGLYAWTQGEIFFVQAWCGAAGKLEVDGWDPVIAKVFAARLAAHANLRREAVELGLEDRRKDAMSAYDGKMVSANEAIGKMTWDVADAALQEAWGLMCSSFESLKDELADEARQNLEAGRYDEAVEVCDKALRCVPDDSAVLALRKEAFWKSSRGLAAKRR